MDYMEPESIKERLCDKDGNVDLTALAFLICREYQRCDHKQICQGAWNNHGMATHAIANAIEAEFAAAVAEARPHLGYGPAPELPPQLIDYRKSLEAAMHQAILSGDKLSPEIVKLVFDMREQYDEAVDAWILETLG